MDDWGQAKAGPFGALRRHIDEGKLGSHNLHAELGQIVAGIKPGRERDDETILFWQSRPVAQRHRARHAMLEKAKRLGLGQSLRYA